MRKTHKLMSEPFARSAARFMKYGCYFLIAFFALGLVLSVIGRQTFTLQFGAETYERAIYAEENHVWTSRGPTVSMRDAVRVTVAAGEKVDGVTHIGLSAMYAVHVIPLLFSYGLLSRVFDNVSRGRIFTEQNASCLLYYGLIQIAVAVLVPFAKLFIAYLTNRFTSNVISIATGQNMVSGAVLPVAFIVAAYIIHYGIHLQDEADHTL